MANKQEPPEYATAVIIMIVGGIAFWWLSAKYSTGSAVGKGGSVGWVFLAIAVFLGSMFVGVLMTNRKR